MRFVAPARSEVDPAVFDRPPLSSWREFDALLRGLAWPDTQALNALRQACASRAWPGGDGVAAAPGHAVRTGHPPRWPHSRSTPPHFVEQTAQLLADGLHYEQRIAAHGAIATRPGNWHDLLNALVWIRYPQLKAALNARQVAEIDIAGPKRRTRAQCALTHFDEAGAIVVLRDATLLPLWDAHDWPALFCDRGPAWRDGGATVHVFGHALLEHALRPGQLVAAKALVVACHANVDNAADPARAIDAAAAAIAAGGSLNDPQELRPLPLSGIPGWHADNGTAAFYRDTPCFRPLRPGRRYPSPLRIDQ